MAHFSSDIESACPIEVVDKEGFDSWLVSQSAYIKSWVNENKFQANLFDFLIIASPLGKVEKVVYGWGTETDRNRDRFHFAKIRDLIPNGTYKITIAPNDFNFLEAYHMLISNRVEPYLVSLIRFGSIPHIGLVLRCFLLEYPCFL